MFRSVLATGAVLAMVGMAGCGSDSTTASPSVAPAATSAAATAAAGAAAGSNAVQITNFAFKPATLSVTSGTSVTWTNKDSAAHTVTGTDFDSGNLADSATFSHTFAAAGTFNYHCNIHSFMTATITVT